MNKLAAEHLTVAYDSAPVIEDLSLSIPDGKITILIGSNGCGKSTILRTLGRLLSPNAGHVYLDGKRIDRLPSKEVAKQMAILPQSPSAPDGLTVKELCYYGRNPHKGLFSRHTAEDMRMVEWALKATRMQEFAERTLDQLSGGQRQRAWIAMALAQETDYLLLDEPTTYLDLAHQVEVLELLRDLNRTFGRTIIMVLHDLNQAARYADHLVSVFQGKVYAQGAPKEVFTAELIHNVFGLNVKVIEDPVEHTPMLVPVGLCQCEGNCYWKTHSAQKSTT
ncbi:ABC transporter ATP-binding protein [Marinicrinis lubricantis]|uniref:ABC transporter ATP-binding protein n=1 Tax=Marinicrinis lubricantis TaxID=2086470 RepID=A0ABW1IPW3_9BACL